MIDLTHLNPSDFGFDLKNREIAALTYTVAFFAFGAIVARRAAWQVVRIFFSPKIFSVFVAMTLYVMASVALLAALQLWEWSNFKTALVWWMTFAATTLFQANTISEKPGAFGKLIRDAINWTAVIVFVAEFGGFPLWGEFILIPVVTLIGIVLMMAPRETNGALLIKPLTFLQSFAGLFILAGGAWHVVTEFKKFASLDQLREFADPILLTLLYVPFLYVFAALMTHESTFTSIRFMKKNDGLVRYAQWKAVLAFGLDMDGVRRLARSLRTDEIQSRADVDAAIREIKLLKQRERLPPAVSASEGWSPYEAQRFLAEFGIVTGDYHRSFDSWWAEAPSTKLTERPFTDHISYYIGGREQAVTRLRLALDASFANDTAAADAAFYERTQALLTKVFGIDEAVELVLQIKATDDLTLLVQGKTIKIERHQWGDSKSGGYGRNLVILHNAHAPADWD